MSFTLLWLAGRLAGSVGASVLQKHLLEAGVGPGRLWWVTYGLLVVPALVLLPAAAMPSDAAFWMSAIAAAVLDVAGNLAMAVSLRDSDLSVFGPLNAFRPALAALAGWWLLGEVPTAGGVAGMGVLVVGAAILLKPDPAAAPEPRARRIAGVFWRVLGLSLSTLGASYLKRSMSFGPPVWTLGVWILAGAILVGLFRWIPGAQSRALWKAGPPAARTFLGLHALLFLGMQWATLEVFRSTLLGYAFALFQLGMVAQVFLGRWIFREPHFRRRLLACGVMSAGALLLMLTG